jgi:hypothetical protein
VKIDYEYINKILVLILENEHPDFKIDMPGVNLLWDGNGGCKDKKFVFHMEILKDQSFIENSIDPSRGIGFKRLSGGEINFSITPLRLTADGHQFASDLSKPGVIDQLKTSFMEAGPSEAVRIVLSIGQQILEKRLEKLIDG